MKEDLCDSLTETEVGTHLNAGEYALNSNGKIVHLYMLVADTETYTSPSKGRVP